MPFTSVALGPDLAIQLDNNGVHGDGFLPGDTISGTITRQSHIVMPQAQVNIRLFGRAKGKVKAKAHPAHTSFSDPSMTFRSRVDLLGESIKATVHDGPIHVAKVTDTGKGEPPAPSNNGESQGAARWHFSLMLPARPDPTTVAKAVHELCYPRQFVTETVDDPSQWHYIPPTFYSSGTNHSQARKEHEAFVEYALVAELIDPELKQRSIFDEPGVGKTKTLATATLPIEVRPVAVPALTDIAMGLAKAREPVPEGREAVKQKVSKISKLFGKSHKTTATQAGAATTSLDWKFGYPRVVQLNAVAPAQLHVLVTPTAGGVISPQASNTLKIHSIKLNIQSFTDVEFDEPFPEHFAPYRLQENNVGKVEMNWGDLETGGGLPVTAPPAPAGGGQQQPQVFDISKAVNLRFAPDHVSWGQDHGLEGRAQLSARLYPSFSTYNVQRSYKIEWKLAFSLDGKKLTHQSCENVHFVAGPPREGDALVDDKGQHSFVPAPPAHVKYAGIGGYGVAKVGMGMMAIGMAGAGGF